MTIDQAVALLTGTTGCLVLSLLINYLQYKGRLINPKAVTPREDFEKQVAINAEDTALFGVVAAAMKKLAAGLKQVVANGNGEDR